MKQSYFFKDHLHEFHIFATQSKHFPEVTSERHLASLFNTVEILFQKVILGIHGNHPFLRPYSDGTVTTAGH